MARHLVVAWVAFAFLGHPTAGAADRHVYLDINGNGILNDCPNPAHNAKGTSNTDDLQFCNGGTSASKLIGTAPGRTTSALCASGGGSVANVVNGVSVDVDGDGTPEFLYGHPQACVYNMGKSDSCEVHAGTYAAPGAQCTANCGDFSSGGGTIGQCYDWNCYLATVAAFGYGPNLDGTGYGTATAPAFLRGASMNGSIDTWDPNRDKNPGDASYSAVLSGNSNRGIAANSAFDLTSCAATDCTGDAFFAVLVGCGGSNSSGYGQINCPTTLADAEERVKVDTNADGTFDTSIGASGAKKVDHLIIRDLEFRGYNGGNGGTSGSARNRQGHINLNGDGNADGLKIEHIFMHGNSFGHAASVAVETFWAQIADMQNSGCAGFTEVRDSLIHQNNKFVFNDDGSSKPANGCSWLIHDNRIWVDVKGSRATPAIGYWKNLDHHPEDGRPKQVRFFNNEVIYYKSDADSDRGWFADSQHFGNSGGQGRGEFWLYGNIFRIDPTNVRRPDLFLPTFCSEESDQTANWRFYYFNNTWDGWSSTKSVRLSKVCGSSSDGELYVGVNNVEVYTTEEQATTAALTKRVSNNRSDDSARCSGTSRYWNCGANPTVNSGLVYYAPWPGGGLQGAGSCDPDGDGIAGVDYDGNGVNDTTWVDLAGNLVSCPSMSAGISIGAIQLAGAGSTDTSPPNSVEGLTRTDKGP